MENNKYIVRNSFDRINPKNGQIKETFNHGDIINPTDIELKYYPEKFIIIKNTETPSKETQTENEVLKDGEVPEVNENTETPSKETQTENEVSRPKRSRRSSESV